jgi:hypothetical protein
MSRKSLPVVLSESESIRLDQWIRAGSTPQQVALRAKIILGAGRGQSDQQTARELKVQRRTAALWRRRFREQGIGCVWEMAPGRGRKAFYDNAKAARIVETTLQPSPRDQRTGAPAPWRVIRASARTRFTVCGRSTNSSRI